MFNDIVTRTETFMSKVENINVLEKLSREEDNEAKCLMASIVEYVERESCFPAKYEPDYITEDGLVKINKYHLWFEGRKNLTN